MKVQLINIGMNKVNRTVEVKDFSGIYKEVKKHLMSKGIDIIPNNNNETEFVVLVGGFRQVGEVKIIQEEIPSREEVESIEPDKYDRRFHFDELQADDERGRREEERE